MDIEEDDGPIKTKPNGAEEAKPSSIFGNLANL